MSAKFTIPPKPERDPYHASLMAGHYRYSITRLRDGAQRWTNRRPRRDMSRTHYMAWDHERNEEVTP